MDGEPENQDNDFDLSSAISQIQNMMNSDDGQAKLNNIINAFMGSDDGDNSQNQTQGSNTNNPSFGDGVEQMDMMIKLGNIMSAMKAQKNGPAETLLYALKPYLKESRRERTDGAIKIMGMIKAFSILKESGFDFNFIP